MGNRWLVGVMRYYPATDNDGNRQRYEHEQGEADDFEGSPSDQSHLPLAAFVEIDYLHDVVPSAIRLSARAAAGVL